jgi:hypothetical protein
LKLFGKLLIHSPIPVRHAEGIANHAAQMLLEIEEVAAVPGQESPGPVHAVQLVTLSLSIPKVEFAVTAVSSVGKLC